MQTLNQNSHQVVQSGEGIVHRSQVETGTVESDLSHSERSLSGSSPNNELRAGQRTQDATLNLILVSLHLSCSSLLSSSGRPSETKTSFSKRSPSGGTTTNFDPPTDRCCPRQPRVSCQQAAGRTEELSVNPDGLGVRPVPAQLVTCCQPLVSFLPFRVLAFCRQATPNHRPHFGPPAACPLHPLCAVSSSDSSDG